MGGTPWVALGWGVAALTAPSPGQPRSEELVRVRLVSENAELAPGRDNWLALEFTIGAHWHLYWDGRNDSGMPPSVNWTLPDGFRVGTIRWPAPRRHVMAGGLLDHVYEDRVTLLVPLAVPADAAPGAVRVAAELRWLVCSDVCLPGEAHVAGEWRVGPAPAAGTPTNPGPEARVFAAARERIPRPLPQPAPDGRGPVTMVWKPGEVEIHAPGAERVAFYAGNECSPLRDLLTDGEARGDHLVIRLNTDHDGPIRLVGILEAVMPRPAPAMIWSLDAPPPGTTNRGGG